MRAAFVLLVGITATVGVTHAETLDIYILAGQSNMSGRAPLEGIPTFKNAAHVFAYRAGRWQPAHEPIADEPEAKLGPSLSFADALFDLRPHAIGLVNCAKGGTKIEQWQPSEDPNSLFAFCVLRAKEASERGRIAGFLWYQGEFDTWTMDAAEGWPIRFLSMIKGFRQNFGSEKLPVIFTQIGPRPSNTDRGWPPLTRLIELQGQLKVQNAAMVSAADLSYQNDHLHLDQRSELELGRMYAKAMNALLKDVESNR